MMSDITLRAQIVIPIFKFQTAFFKIPPQQLYLTLLRLLITVLAYSPLTKQVFERPRHKSHPLARIPTRTHQLAHTNSHCHITVPIGTLQPQI